MIEILRDHFWAVWWLVVIVVMTIQETVESWREK
jgi:hypothetical protein